MEPSSDDFYPEKIEDPATLRTWINSAKEEEASTTAARAALRILPISLGIESSRSRALSTEDRKELLLLTFRCSFLAYYALRRSYPASELLEQTREATLSLGSAIDTFRSRTEFDLDSEISLIAMEAVAHSAISTLLPVHASFVDAFKRISETLPESDKNLWSAFQADREAITSGKDPTKLPLWIPDVRGNSHYVTNFPDWARKPFDAFDSSQYVRKGPWGIWLAWYRSLLPDPNTSAPRSFFGPEIDTELAFSPESFWSTRPAESVVSEIANLLKERPDPFLIEATRSHSDEPTANDQLGRKPFAQALVDRMYAIRKEGGPDGFSIHLHAPWGAGKTSILRMMRDIMETSSAAPPVRKQNLIKKIAITVKSFLQSIGAWSIDIARIPMSSFWTNAHVKPQGDQVDLTRKKWVVVDFNAWAHKKRNPPWWPLIEMIKEACVDDLEKENKFKRARKLHRRWRQWVLLKDWLPVVFALAFFFLLTPFLVRGEDFVLSALGFVTSVGTAIAAFVAAGRFFAFGSSVNAKFYSDLSNDPLKDVKSLFVEIVEQADKPICVFIDDLDRCNADYVVDLLEGLQTSFRHRNVSYVVAADRGWIRASFRDRYSKFSNLVGSEGQPIGYLFLEKIFQLSTPIPGMEKVKREQFWQRLLLTPDNKKTAAQKPTREPSDLEIREKLSEIEEYRRPITTKFIQEIVRLDNSPAMIAAAVKAANESLEAESEREHLLAQYSSILPDNPRLMKRMVNAFAFRQSISILEGTFVDVSALARWTILEQRYPAAAEVLGQDPEWITQIGKNVAPDKLDKVPERLRPFNELKEIREVIGLENFDNATKLTADHIKDIVRGSKQ